MNNLSITALFLTLILYSNAFSYEFDFVNLSDYPRYVEWVYNEMPIGVPSGDENNLQPGDWITFKKSGSVAGYCLQTISVSSVQQWDKAVCHNQGFTIAEDGTLKEGSNVSLHQVSIKNGTGTNLDLDFKVFILDQSGSGKGGPKENKITLGNPLIQGAPTESIPFYGAQNVYKINLLRLTNPKNNNVSTFFAGIVPTQDMNFTVQIDPMSDEIYLVANNQRYDSLESVARIAQKRMEVAIKRSE